MSRIPRTTQGTAVAALSLRALAAARVLLVLVVCCALAPLAWRLPAGAAHALRADPAARQAALGDDAVYAGDVSVPDHTVFSPGQHFVKTWRIRNVGSHAWTQGYRWHFEAGSQLSTLTSVPVAPTRPGATISISVPMAAPVTPGSYTSFWQMTDAAGRIFGHQAWVSIVVRKGASPAPATPLPSATPTARRGGQSLSFPSATPRPAPSATPRPAPSATPRRAASATPRPASPTPDRPTATAAPTFTLPGGDGSMVASPWTGALAYHTYFAAGSTAHGAEEVISLYYPGPGIAHVHLTLYRADAAHRVLLLTLHPAQRMTLPLSRIAPNTDQAVAVEADRHVIANRLLVLGHSTVGDPGAARSARRWWFTGAPHAGDQQLVFFNPHDEAARVTLSFARATGGCCARTLTVTVPPLRQFTDDLGTSTALDGPLSIVASSVVAVERIVAAPDRSTVVGLPGTATLATAWYLPDVRADMSGSAIAVFNPGAAPATATIRVALKEGPGQWLRQAVPPFAQILVPLDKLAALPAVGVTVSSTRPVVAASLSTDPAQTGFYMGSSAADRSWVLVGVNAGAGSDQTISVLNPNAAACTVTFSVMGAAGKGATWRATVPAEGQIARIVDGLVPADGGIIQIQASAPVAVGRTLSSRGGLATSTGVALSSDHAG